MKHNFIMRFEERSQHLSIRDVTFICNATPFYFIGISFYVIDKRYFKKAINFCRNFAVRMSNCEYTGKKVIWQKKKASWQHFTTTGEARLGKAAVAKVEPWYKPPERRAISKALLANKVVNVSCKLDRFRARLI